MTIGARSLLPKLPRPRPARFPRTAPRWLTLLSVLAQVAAISVPPLCALGWNWHRITGEREQRLAPVRTQSAAYAARTQTERDRKHRLAVGQFFPGLNRNDVSGRRLPIGSGGATRVLFLGTGPFGLSSSWADLIARYPGEYLIIVLTQPFDTVRAAARETQASRCYFVGDFSSRLHDWFGAHQRREFQLDGQGRILRIAPLEHKSTSI